jgi:hypothetical protein
VRAAGGLKRRVLIEKTYALPASVVPTRLTYLSVLD